VKERDRVFHEYVPLLEDPWGYEGLARKKAQRALEQVKRRPEYVTPYQTLGRAGHVHTATEQPASSPLDHEPRNPHLGI
jgi:hypothetical protein